MTTHEVEHLGDFLLESGAVLREAKLAYKTWGRLDRGRTNAVLVCSFITGTHQGYDFLIEEGRCLDPRRFFIIGANLFGNGLSSSPSNTSAPSAGPDFPNVSIRDNVRAQHKLVRERFAISRLALVAGFSMGAQQAYQWAVSYPAEVERIAAWCGHAHTTPHTLVFLDGLASVIKASVDWNGGHYAQTPIHGLRAAARVYAGWGMSQAWYRDSLWTQLGFSTLEDLLVGFWEKYFIGLEANDFLAQIETWKGHNVGDTPSFSGDYRAALSAVQARALVMPSTTDLYFPPEDAEAEARCLRDVEFAPIESSWGHWAGIGINEADRRFIDKRISELLVDFRGDV
jgi:homoserine O-acetyltransferase